MEQNHTDFLVSAEMIERLKAQDKRWQDIDLAQKIDMELTTSVALPFLLKAAEKDADDALQALGDVDPTDTKKITMLQARVYRARFMHQTLQMCLTRGEDALESLQEEGPVNIEDRIEGDPNAKTG